MNRSKYGAIKTEVDGITFHSRKEAARYQELILRQKAGEITDLELQVSFPCAVNGKIICKYIADFWYYDLQENCQVIEDVKGFKTPVYKIKKKLVESIYDLKITEV